MCTCAISSHGEVFQEGRHVPGTEVKAITYSNMQVLRSDDGFFEAFVIIDI
jgi:SHS2 domain-containing protein